MKIIDLSNIEVRRLLLKEESYFTFDLPFYFTFNPLLQKISEKMEDNNLSDVNGRRQKDRKLD